MEQLYIIFKTNTDYHTALITDAFAQSNAYFTEQCAHIEVVPKGIAADIDNYDATLKIEGEIKTVTYTKKTPPQPTLEELKAQKIKDAAEYSQSAEVDGCYVGNLLIIFTGSLRSKIANRLSNEEAAGNATVTLYFNGNAFQNKVEVLKQMLLQINLRADKNFDNLQKHIKKINEMTDKDAVKNYNHEAYYQEPLRLDL